MKELKKQIKDKNFKKAYLLFGTEDMLRTMFKNSLKKAIVGDDDMNYAYYEGDGINFQEVIDTCNTMPFFAEKRLIVVENGGVFKNSNDALAEAIKNAPDSTILIFVEEKIDKRSKVYKAINENGYVCEMNKLESDDLRRWVGTEFNKYQKKILISDIDYLIQITDGDMFLMKNEIQKLSAFSGSREQVTREDIDTMCTASLSDKLFDMIDAIAYKNTDKAISIYNDLMALREAPIKILILLGRHFTNLLAVKSMKKDGLSNPEMMKNLGVRDFALKKYLSQCAKLSTKSLKGAVEDCEKADEDIKTGKITDKYALELLILKYAGGNKE